jgi:signal transduction histidine kinase/HAMP domain-containing protein
VVAGRGSESSRVRKGIRFNISLLLLMSSLNGIALLAAVVVLFGTVTERGRSGPELRRGLASQLDQVQFSVLTGAARHEAFSLRSVDPALDEIAAQLGKRAAARVVPELDDYRRALAAWSLASTSSNAVTRDRELGNLRHNHQQVESVLYTLPDRERPEWVERAIPLYPWALAWVVALTLVTIWEAYRLRAVFSRPLERLTAAADAVAAGDLRTEMPSLPPNAGEIAALAHAMTVMRDRLLETLSSIDRRNREMGTILANLGDGVLHVTAAGRVREKNHEADALLESLAGRPLELGEDVRQLLPELPSDWLDAARDTQREMTFGREGKESYLLVKTTPVERSGDPGGEQTFVVVLRDVTQSKEVERLKRDFLSVVTHELKTPLTAIEGYTKLLLMGKAGALSEKQKTFLGTVRDQTGKLKQMIQDLLDVTRLEAGRLPLSMASVPAEEAIADAFEAYKGEAEARNLTMTADASAVEGAHFIADPFRVQQVLGNLVGNAMKFTAEGGTITLGGRIVDGRVELRVTDTGRGIPADAIPKLFDKFFQVQRGDTRVSGGAGLGLYISRELVEAQGGTIGVESVVGEGSTFMMRFPALADASSESTGELPVVEKRADVEAHR